MISAVPSPSLSRKPAALEYGGSFIHSYGSKTFIRPKLDNVLDAVAQAKFNEKKWVWIEDENEGYVRAHIISENENTAEVEFEHGGTAVIAQNMINPMNPPKFDMVDDMAELTHLNEPSVIHNLTVRYKSNQVYTYSGLFLVAVNPYKNLPIYGEEYITSYKGKRRGEMAPHIYAVADQAYHDMVQDKENQSILITGESGAGKTENTKIAIQYLTAIANAAKLQTIEHANTLQNQILRANPILESFGNAQTIRNNNSSRFGKFIRIEFNTRAQICGANIEWYLLEKSRVHHQTPKERNYHIFYQLLEAEDHIKKQLLLDGTIDDYNFIKESSKRIEGVDDAEEYQKLSKSLEVMGLDEKEKLDLFRIVASILHLGNISITDYRDRADVRDFAAVERVCHVLGISAEDFKKSLLAPRIKAGRDWVTQAKSPAQVISSIDALAKTLYERNFAHLVERINRAIDIHQSKEVLGFIGVLDIAGFEIFESNSFEQLCINYTNEKLQQFFNQNMFELEQEEYKREKIDWDYIDFGKDLQPTIDLIEKTNPVGILSCLEEECVAPKGSDKRFLEKLNRFCDKENPDAKYKSTRFKDGFILRHYAGDVEYSVDGWIEKNKDPLNEDITRLLSQSSHPHVAHLFEDYLTDQQEERPYSNRLSSLSGSTSSLTSETGSRSSILKLRKGSGSFRTVGHRHKQQLLSLMNTLHMTHPHFVRCILPNNRKYAGEIQTKLVQDQLRCNGVLEGIRICRKGFPNRLSFDIFRKRYQVLCPDLLETQTFIDGRTACQILVEHLNLDKEVYQIGSTKVFFKATVLATLEELRDSKLSTCITQFQAYCRARMALQFRTRFSRQTEAIRIMQSNARIYNSLREWSWWKIYVKLKPLNAAYGMDIQMSEKEQKITALEETVKTRDQTITTLLDRTQSLESEHQEVQKLILAEQQYTKALEEQKLDLQARYGVLEERLEELEAALEEKELVRERLQVELESVIEAAEESNTRAESSMLVQNRLKQELTLLKGQVGEVTGQLESALKEKEEVEAKLGRLETEAEHCQAQLVALEEKVKLQEEGLGQMESKNKEFESSIADHLKEIEELKNALRLSQENEQKVKEELCVSKGNEERIKEDLRISQENEQSLKEALDTMKESEQKTKEALSACRENEQKTKEELTTLQADSEEIRNKLDSESKLKEEWFGKYTKLKADWDALTALVKSESDQAKERMARFDQVLSSLQFT